MKAAFIIARLTLIETMRRQIELLTFFLAVFIWILPGITTAFGLGAIDRIVKDVALTVIGYYTVALALFFGSVTVPAEIERKTILPLITRPLPRRAYLWGKWLGVMGFISFSIVILGAALQCSMAITMHVYDPRVWVAIVGYLTEAAVLSAVCMTCSTFCSPPLAGVLGVFVYLMGGLPDAFIGYFLGNARWPAFLTFLPTKLHIAQALKAMLPHFEFFQLKNSIVHGDPIFLTYVLSTMAYGVMWIVFLQLLGEVTFSRRDL